MSSSFSHRMRKFTLRIFNRLVQCCDRNGAINVGNGADEILSEEECNVFRKLLSKNISMEFILEMKARLPDGKI